ncbi:hypothetical protein HDU83_006218 [Entophlyctis luteolus]|nr:hypothetical protein HDU83_006218 [Entophlyctis luteolus]
MTSATIAKAIEEVVRERKDAIFNKGELHAEYTYFSVDDHLPVIGKTIGPSRGNRLYYTVAADVIVFSRDRKYVLLYHRCPHRNCDNTGNSKISSDFSYGGTLSLPGGFFHYHEDVDQYGFPDFVKFGKRLLKAELGPYYHNRCVNEPSFVDVEFNQYRDIRWHQTAAYVPTVSLLFCAELKSDFFSWTTGFPKVWRMKNSICERGYWVEKQIIREVYWRNRTVYQSFQNTFDETQLNQFIEQELYVDPDSRKPKNKKRSENAVLKTATQRREIAHDDRAKYSVHDFAFDHPKLIMAADDRCHGAYLPSPPLSPQLQHNLNVPANLNVPVDMRSRSRSRSPIQRQQNLAVSDNELNEKMKELEAVSENELNEKMKELEDKSREVVLSVLKSRSGRDKDVSERVERLMNAEVTLEEFLHSFADILPQDEFKNADYSMIATLESALNYAAMAQPFVSIAFLVVKVAYKLANAKKQHKELRESLYSKFARAVDELECLTEIGLEALPSIPKTKSYIRKAMINLLDCLLDAAKVCAQEPPSGWRILTGDAAYRRASNAIDNYRKYLESAKSTLNLALSHLRNIKHEALFKPNGVFAEKSETERVYRYTNYDISKSIIDILSEKGDEIKNKGELSESYTYFRNNELHVKRRDKINSDRVATAKFYTVTADCILFDSSASYVLMQFRCPHKDHRNNDLSLSSAFTYGGCLGTPGTFYIHAKDSFGVNADYVKFSKRVSDIALSSFENSSQAVFDRHDYLFPQFNNFRDVRWQFSPNYVPALALQFAAILSENSSEDGSLPKLERQPGKCAYAYWVDIKIIKEVFEKNRAVFDMFDNEYNDHAFSEFVRNRQYFSIGNDESPQNQFQNSIISGVPTDNQIINFDRLASYSLRDFAFDHVRNIVSAYDVLTNSKARE